MNVKISQHAINRYRERIAPLPDDNGLARLEIFDRLCEAKPKHIRKITKRRRTVVVPIKRGFLVFSFGTIVTALKYFSEPNQPENVA